MAATSGLAASSSGASSAWVRADRASDCSRVFSDLEDVDVGARDERVPGADQDDRVDGGIAVRARDALVDGFPDAGAERVDGRVVDGQDRDAVLHLVVDELRHRRLPLDAFASLRDRRSRDGSAS